MSQLTPLSQQSAKEYAAGYRSGLNGEDMPRREKGQSYRHGWENGRQDKQEQQGEQK